MVIARDRSEFFGSPLLNQEQVKLRTSNFVCIFTELIGTKVPKSMKSFGTNRRGRIQGVQKVFRSPIYRAHCAVIFGIAQLSC